MTSKLDQSLDDIAKSQRTRGGGSSRRGSGGRTGPSRRGRQAPRNQPYSRPPATQDKSPRLAPVSKILVSNLDPSVTSEDVEDIFEQIGRVSRSVVNYDQHGKSLRTAEVTFVSKADAERAVKDYDGAEVDGRPMYLKLVASIAATPRFQPPQRSQQQSRGAPRGGRDNRRGSGGNNNNRGSGGNFRGNNNNNASNSRGGGRQAGGRGRGGRRGEGKPTATAEQLDAEMEAYHNGRTAGAVDPSSAGQPPAPTKPAPSASTSTTTTSGSDGQPNPAS